MPGTKVEREWEGVSDQMDFPWFLNGIMLPCLSLYGDLYFNCFPNLQKPPAVSGSALYLA